MVKIGRSRPEVFCKKCVLRSFAKFTVKHLCQSLFFNKVAGLRPATLFKKRPWHRCFPVNFAKLLRTLLFRQHLRWLLLSKFKILNIDIFNIIKFEFFCSCEETRFVIVFEMPYIFLHSQFYIYSISSEK